MKDNIQKTEVTENHKLKYEKKRFCLFVIG